MFIFIQDTFRGGIPLELKQNYHHGETSTVRQIYSLQIIFFVSTKTFNIIHFGFKDGVSVEASHVIYLD